MLPIPMSVVAFFICHLHQKGTSPKSTLTYLSAISYVHKLHVLPDPTKGFLVQKLLVGVQRLSPSSDVRLPITIPLLHKMLKGLSYTIPSYHVRVMFQAAFSLAFYAFARVGEISIRSSTEQDTVIQENDIKFMIRESDIISATVVFRFFKHNLAGRPHNIQIDRIVSCFCPITLLQNYLALRGDIKGPLFLLPGGSCLTRYRFDKELKSVLHYCGLDTSLYKGHSFRIGAATLAAELGFSDAKIRQMGRWKSDAFKKYIRSPALSN